MASNAITFEAYKAAADRIRRGKGRPGDSALCERYEAQGRPEQPAPRSWYDLPMAARMWKADAKDGGHL